MASAANHLHNIVSSWPHVESCSLPRGAPPAAPLAARAPADPASPPPVFPSCHIFVNHAYRFIYVRHAKAASTSLLDFFGFCGAGASSRNSSCLERLDVSRGGGRSSG